MPLLHLLFGKPTHDEWERVKDVKSRKTWKVVYGGIGLDACEVLESPGYKDAIDQIRKMEADHSWVC